MEVLEFEGQEEYIYSTRQGWSSIPGSTLCALASLCTKLTPLKEGTGSSEMTDTGLADGVGQAGEF